MLVKVSETDSVIYYTYTQDSLKSFYRGQKRYELSNHLGNVLAVITDRRIQACGAGDVMHYEAQVVSASDYYPFGSTMEDRSWAATEYKFGFGGQEMDNEVSGEGNSYTATFWQYDSRLGRRFNVDPRPNPSISNYACFANNPISIIDPFGDTTRFYNKQGDLKYTLNDNLENMILVVSDKMANNLASSKNNENSLEQRNELAGYLRNPCDHTEALGEDLADKVYSNIIGIIDNKTIGQMKQIANSSQSKEAGFVVTIDEHKKFQFTQLSMSGGSGNIDLPSAIANDFPNGQAFIFAAGHTHPMGGLTDYQKKNNTNTQNNMVLGKPTMDEYNPYSGTFKRTYADYAPALRTPSGDGRQSMMFIITPYGFTIYRSSTDRNTLATPNYSAPGHKAPTKNDYYMFKQF